MEGRPVRAWVWAGLSVVSYLLAELATIPIIYFAEGILQAPHAVGLTLWATSRVLLAALVTLILGRILLRPKPLSGVPAWMIAASGAVLSAAIWVALLSWSEVRYGAMDIDQLGVTKHLAAAVGGVAVAGFATVAAPEGATRPPMIATLIATAVTAFIVAANLPGLADGVAPESIPLAATIGATLVYSVVVSWLVGRQLERPER